MYRITNYQIELVFDLENGIYSIYYCQNCIFQDNQDNCKEETILNKAFDFIGQYPCFPIGSLLEHKQFVIPYQIHENLVIEFNNMVQEYQSRDIDNLSKYKKIKPFMDINKENTP